MSGARWVKKLQHIQIRQINYLTAGQQQISKQSSRTCPAHGATTSGLGTCLHSNTWFVPVPGFISQDSLIRLDYIGQVSLVSQFRLTKQVRLLCLVVRQPVDILFSLNLYISDSAEAYPHHLDDPGYPRPGNPGGSSYRISHGMTAIPIIPPSFFNHRLPDPSPCICDASGRCCGGTGKQYQSNSDSQRTHSCVVTVSLCVHCITV